MNSYEAIRRAIEEAFKEMGHLKVVVLSTEEGLPVAVYGRSQAEDQEVLSAVVTEAAKAFKLAARTFGVGRIKKGVIETESGVLAFGEAAPGYYLAVLAAPEAMPGEVLLAFRELQGKLRKAIEVLEA